MCLTRGNEDLCGGGPTCEPGTSPSSEESDRWRRDSPLLWDMGRGDECTTGGAGGGESAGGLKGPSARAKHQDCGRRLSFFMSRIT